MLTEETEGMFDIIENNDISSMPELTADQKATAEIVKGIIEELPELQKAAVVAYYFDGLKVERIAELMECSVNTIKSRLNYARKYIKERVEEKEKKEALVSKAEKDKSLSKHSKFIKSVGTVKQYGYDDEDFDDSFYEYDEE